MPQFQFNHMLTRKAIRSAPQVHALVVYDIPDNRRRLAVYKLLKGFGIRVQYSGFETIQPRPIYQRMMAKLTKLIEPEDDNVRVYIIHSAQDVITLGLGGAYLDEDVVVL